MSVIYVCWQYQTFWIVNLFLTDVRQVSRVLVCSSIFYYSKKVNQRNCARIFQILTVTFGESAISRTQDQLWYNRFKEGREDSNDDAHPGRPSTSHQSMKTLKLWRKWFWINIESLLERLLMILAYRSAHTKKFLQMF